MITNLTGWGNANLLADEQDLAGDPASGKGNQVFTRWYPGWSDWYYPSSAIIDLKAEYDISEVCIYDGAGTGNISVFTGSPSTRSLLFNSNLQQYLTWNCRQVNVKTRFIQVQVNEMGAVPEEIVIYGKKTGTDINEPAAVSHPKPLMKNFIGVNGFIDDPLEVSRAVNFVREYHNWGWNERNQDKIRFSPAYPGWDFDSYYKRMKEAGITVVPCLKESPSWIAEKNEEKPVKSGLDTQDPKSYKEKAGFMFQYAARYGARAVNKNLLKLDASQEPKTGLNYLKYYEDWNEQDKWWLGRKAYFTPFEYAAMASANYDGHKGALGPGYGIKTADPGAVLVMGGLTGLNLEYIKAMRLWAEYNRDGDFPADVINFHPYSNDGGGQSGAATTGVSPEQDNLKSKLKTLVDYRNRYLPGKEIWVTEFGYDINQGSPQKAPAIGTFTAEEVQAMWLVRSYLEMAAAGVDRAAMYMVRDAGELSSTVKYSTSGLTEGKNIKKRQSWYYVKTLNNLLGNYRFEREMPGGHVRNYKFTDDVSGSTIYMIWSPDSKQTVIKDYTFKLPEGSRKYAVVGFKNNDENGDTLQISARPSGTVKFEVSEKPVFIIVAAAEKGQLKAPVANFSGSASVICIGSPVTFSDLSSPDAISWKWQFGEGATPASAEGKGPHVVYYSTEGAKTVSLEVGGTGGITGTARQNLLNVCSRNSTPVTSDVEACQGTDIPPLTAEGDFIKWYSDAGLTVEAGTGNHLFHGITTAGNYKFYAVSDNGKNCRSNPAEATLIINKAGEAFITGLHENYPLDNTVVSLSGHPEGGTFEGAGIKEAMLDIMEAGAGKHRITYTFVDSNGCTATTSSTFSIYVSTAAEGSFRDSGIEVFPNPANTGTTVRYSLLKESNVTISLFDTYGKETCVSRTGKVSSGIHSFKLDKDVLNLPSGMYLLKLTVNREVKMVKVIFN